MEEEINEVMTACKVPMNISMERKIMWCIFSIISHAFPVLFQKKIKTAVPRLYMQRLQDVRTQISPELWVKLVRGERMTKVLADFNASGQLARFLALFGNSNILKTEQIIIYLITYAADRNLELRTASKIKIPVLIGRRIAEFHKKEPEMDPEVFESLVNAY